MIGRDPREHDDVVAVAVSWGPWSRTLTDANEGRAQLRSLAAIAAVMFGSGHHLVELLRRAETDTGASEEAHLLIERLPTATRMRMLSVFQVITWRPPPRLTAIERARERVLAMPDRT